MSYTKPGDLHFQYPDSGQEIKPNIFYIQVQHLLYTGATSLYQCDRRIHLNVSQGCRISIKSTLIQLPVQFTAGTELLRTLSQLEIIEMQN